ncbi:MAG: sorbosone dehydrogenase family protein [Chloroflexi bacterium]|nr:sorbosone dehydrogenase family protein [Chloroflexota bacterium]
MGDWTTDAPGVRRRITVSDLPAPYATKSVDSGPQMIPRPEGASPKAPSGFRVSVFAAGLDNPRALATAPNGDVFVAESAPGRIVVLRRPPGSDGPAQVATFATGLDKPFGLAFYPPGRSPRYLYVGNTGSVVRFPYRSGDLTARAPAEMVVPDIPSGGLLRGGGHWTRDIAFSRDGKRMYVSVGSVTNDWEGNRGAEFHRADILEFTPDGKDGTVYASGIRNAVGIATNPRTGDLWASVNERDGLGDDLVPDYITRVRRGQFYGWPWFYIGPHQDPRHAGEREDLRSQVAIPDVLIQSHSSSLQMAFYDGRMFPRAYDGDAFAAEHGSWNRSRRTGYKIIRVLLDHGRPTGEYEDFVTGFVTPEGKVWGRPVGVTVGGDGALIFSDDGSGTIWRVSYGGAPSQR